MKILHYSLGFPPYRTGGLTKFCMDLMKQQLLEGHEVALLWPGEIKILNKKTTIKYTGKLYDIASYEVKNPTPVSYDEGIQDIEPYMEEGDVNAYQSFLNEFQPDIIHIHTLMGLHKNFLVAAKANGIRMVFSAHDFFPICPKVTMFNGGKNCECVTTCRLCEACNTTALSNKKIMILQSPFYRKMKGTFLIKKIRKNHRDSYLSGSMEVQNMSSEAFTGNSEKYIELREYYNAILRIVDVIHYNSSITKSVYEKYMIKLPMSEIISITHADINNNKKEKCFSDFLRITYLGPQSRAKGYFVLKDALDMLWTEKKDISLNVFFEPIDTESYINAHERYTYDELESIFDKTDVLVTPSLWCETFGYTVLEALSYGVPVIISGTVGAKDIVNKDTGIVIDDIDKISLYRVFKALTKESLRNMNKSILETTEILTIEEMSKLLYEKCYYPC